MSGADDGRLVIFELPTVEQVMDSHSTSYWLKSKLQSALKRDSLDE